MDDPRKWRRGILAPIERNLTTGELRWAVPQTLMDLASAFALPGDVVRGTVDPMSPEGLQRAQTFATSMMGGGMSDEVGQVGRGAAEGLAGGLTDRFAPPAEVPRMPGTHAVERAEMYDPPVVPLRPFEADYPFGAPSDATENSPQISWGTHSKPTQGPIYSGSQKAR